MDFVRCYMHLVRDAFAIENEIMQAIRSRFSNSAGDLNSACKRMEIKSARGGRFMNATFDHS
eukprot:9075906-Karenia_brevis.AAC.1